MITLAQAGHFPPAALPPSLWFSPPAMGTNSDSLRGITRVRRSPRNTTVVLSCPLPSVLCFSSHSLLRYTKLGRGVSRAGEGVL